MAGVPTASVFCAELAHRRAQRPVPVDEHERLGGGAGRGADLGQARRT